MGKSGLEPNPRSNRFEKGGAGYVRAAPTLKRLGGPLSRAGTATGPRGSVGPRVRTRPVAGGRRPSRLQRPRAGHACLADALRKHKVKPLRASQSLSETFFRTGYKAFSPKKENNSERESRCGHLNLSAFSAPPTCGPREVAKAVGGSGQAPSCRGTPRSSGA